MLNVGTEALGCAVHNASVGRAPVLIFAGVSPITLEGEMRGSRTEFIHWLQDVPDQKQIVGQYCRYTAEIKTGKNIKQVVNRALQFSRSEPAGPVYLCGSREVMEEEISPYSLQQEHWDPVEPAALSSQAVKNICNALIGARAPLIITGYSGRNPKTPAQLVKLADTVKGLQVLDTGGNAMSFPADHRGWLSVRYGVHDCIKTADVILVIDCDVPWHPNATLAISQDLPHRHRPTEAADAALLSGRGLSIPRRQLRCPEPAQRVSGRIPRADATAERTDIFSEVGCAG